MTVYIPASTQVSGVWCELNNLSNRIQEIDEKCNSITKKSDTITIDTSKKFVCGELICDSIVCGLGKITIVERGVRIEDTRADKVGKSIVIEWGAFLIEDDEVSEDEKDEAFKKIIENEGKVDKTPEESDKDEASEESDEDKTSEEGNFDGKLLKQVEEIEKVMDEMGEILEKK